MAGELSVHRVILGGHMLQMLSQSKKSASSDAVKLTLTEAYVKHVLQTKMKVGTIPVCGSQNI